MAKKRIFFGMLAMVLVFSLALVGCDNGSTDDDDDDNNSGPVWTAVTPGTDNDTTGTFGTGNIRGIAYGGNTFVAGGSGGSIAYSIDQEE
jgi:hypothetical protein